MGIVVSVGFGENVYSKPPWNAFVLNHTCFKNSNSFVTIKVLIYHIHTDNNFQMVCTFSNLTVNVNLKKDRSMFHYCAKKLIFHRLFGQTLLSWKSFELTCFDMLNL